VTRRLVGIAVVLLLGWGGLAAAILTDTTPRLGLDLQGGTAVILTAPEGTDPELLEVATQIMANRIEDFGAVQEPEIAISGDDTVVVQLPGVDDEQRAIDAVGQTGLSVSGRYCHPPPARWGHWRVPAPKTSTTIPA
jgi:preprotein translocase subunit SecD